MTGTERVYEERGVRKREAERQKREGEREEERRGVAGCCRACADKGNLQLQSFAYSLARLLRPSPLFLPPSLRAHNTRAQRRRARTHGFVACSSARTHACTSRCRETAGTVGRGSAKFPNYTHSSLPPLLRRPPFRPSSPSVFTPFALLHLLLLPFFWPSERGRGR